MLQSKYPTAIETTLHNYATKEAHKPIYMIHCSKTLRGEGLTLIEQINMLKQYIILVANIFVKIFPVKLRFSIFIYTYKNINIYHGLTFILEHLLIS